MEVQFEETSSILPQTVAVLVVFMLVHFQPSQISARQSYVPPWSITIVLLISILQTT